MTAPHVRFASQRHVELLDSFIRTTEDAMSVQADAFMRDSLTDLLGALRTERDDYARLAGNEQPRASA